MRSRISTTLRHFILSTVLLSANVDAFTLGKANTTNTVGFVEGDNQRDTISLFISCFATLGLCVYSAVHLNIPPKGEPAYQTLLREARWCIIGLFAPELILYTAWRQLAAARQLCDEIGQANTNIDGKSYIRHEKNVLLSEKSAPGTSKRRPWSIAHGYYGVMGGFAIDLDDCDDQHTYLFGNAKRLTLTAKGVALLAHCGHIPEVSIDDIRDKNKTDGLAKLLVCIQAGWMTVQVTARTVTGLPTSLLEVHTVAHVVCALIMYVVWWHKPRQVESPTVLKGEWIWPLAAYMFLASRMSGEAPVGTTSKFRHATPVLKKLGYFEDFNSTVESQRGIDHQDTTQSASNGYFGPRPEIVSLHASRTPSSPVPYDETESTLRRLAVEAVQRYPALRSRFARPNDNDTAHMPYTIPYATELVQPYALDWPNAGLLRRTQSLIMGMVLWGASMLYGAIHVAAWNYFFPSTIEQLFWWLSSVWVTFCAAFWLVTNLLAHVFPFVDKVWVAYNERRLGWLGTIVISALCVLCGVSYVVSRTYLVVEAFASIREVPAEVYDTPSWSQIFPHL